MAFAFCWADVLIELDSDRWVTYAAGAIERLLGRVLAGLIGQPIDALVAPAQREQLMAALEDDAARWRTEGLAISFLDGRGQPRPLRLYGYRLDDLGGRYFLALRSHALPAAPTPSLASARRDGETGLLDGPSFLAGIREQLARGLPERQTLTLVGVNGFEELIDKLPAPARQHALAEIAASLSHGDVDAALAGRLAADRFAVVHGGETAVVALTRGIEKVLRGIDPDGGARVVAGTIALPAGAPADDQLVDGLVFAINRFRTASGSDFSLRELNASLESLAESALASIRTLSAVVRSARFDFAFQPIVDAHTGEIHHYETLFRFPSSLGIASPFEQICFAEHTGLICDLDLAVAEKAIAWMRANTAINGRSRFAINVSGRSINDPRYLECLGELLAANPWTAGRLLFEITESSRVADLESANAFIRRVREGGYEICLDDFGIGAANFQYLSKFEVDYVKLDGSAVHNAARAQKGRAFLSAIVHLCAQLGVAVVAEMIENEALLALVHDCGVQYVQGYLFGQPAADIKRFDAREIRAQVAGIAGPLTPHRGSARRR